MTLYDLICLEHQKNQSNEEFAVTDNKYDICEMYFYSDIIDPQDEWDRAAQKIASKLEVVDYFYRYHDVPLVITNLSEVIQRNVESNPEFATLFIRNEVYPIVEDMHRIIAGHVSEEWMKKFAEGLI